MAEGIVWLGHASFRLTLDGKVIYIDPWKVKRPAPADLVLITHTHFDHFAPDEIRQLCKDSTEIVGPYDCLPKLRGIVQRRQDSIRAVGPGDSFVVHDLRIRAFPAYNLNKDFHPKNKKWVGYLIEAGGRRVYHAGDTDAIHEIRTAQCDVALLPVSGVYVMSAEEAAELAQVIQPSLAIPMHWGDIVGTRADAERFKSLYKGQTEILEKEF
ncbi:MAG: MBL fold metallo-hydrolase [bacterium]